MSGALWVELSGELIVATVKWLTDTPLPARLASVK